jgi:sugar fermentation stimulation protein A
MQDRGSYVLILRVDNGITLDIGRLGRFTFQKGYYLYAGSAMRGLEARIRRHLKRAKKQHWHIDYLTVHADKIIPFVVRSSQRQECEIAAAIASIMQPGPPGFGSSDCHCRTHLFFSPQDPLRIRAFSHIFRGFGLRNSDGLWHNLPE